MRNKVLDRLIASKLPEKSSRCTERAEGVIVCVVFRHQGFLERSFASINTQLTIVGLHIHTNHRRNDNKIDMSEKTCAGSERVLTVQHEKRPWWQRFYKGAKSNRG
tara:strand:- start:570 stop:887 length:318 start_codon:yes stop_codon:yes gene_type:complete